MGAAIGLPRPIRIATVPSALAVGADVTRLLGTPFRAVVQGAEGWQDRARCLGHVGPPSDSRLLRLIPLLCGGHRGMIRPHRRRHCLPPRTIAERDMS